MGNTPSNEVMLEPQLLEFICNDYLRLGEVDLKIVETCDKYLERYITVATASVGLLIALTQLLQPNGVSWYAAAGILLIPLIVGLTTYTRLIAFDFHFRDAEARRDYIVAELKNRYPGFRGFSPDRIGQLDFTYQRWSSTRFILLRSALFGGPKTIIVIGNGILVAMVISIYSAYGFGLTWLPVAIIGVMVFVLTASAHIAYARWRYWLNRQFYAD